jgi:hypothetical protein
VHALVGKVLREIPRLTDRQDRNRWAVWKKAPVLAKRCRAWRHGMGHDGDVDRVRLILISPYRLARNIRSP